MSIIKFGTDGWRAIIAKDFTTANVARAAHGTAQWLANNGKKTVTIGYDCRFGGQLFAETVAKVMAHHGIKSYLSTGFASTPMVSLGTKLLDAGAGIVITASHNPPSYNGFKLKGNYGGPLLPDQVKEVENQIPGSLNYNADEWGIEEFKKNGLIELYDFETMYCNRVAENFDMRSIRKSRLQFAYDAMFGAGQSAMRKLMPEAVLLHCIFNPSFHGTPPEPLLKNLGEFSRLIKKHGNIACGLATDGDADRLGLMDNKGNFIDSHHIILLLVHYLCKYKLPDVDLKRSGSQLPHLGAGGHKVCTAFSTTDKLKKLCSHYGLSLDVVPIGFKHICNIMIREKDRVILGGEESGGIAIRGHIPERDGIWIGLTLWEFMAKSGKSLRELVKEVYAITGPFSFERNDLHIAEEKKQKVIENCRTGNYTFFGKYKVKKVEDLDGFKFYFGEDQWLMFRASGTEPLLRMYAESPGKKTTLDMLKAGYDVVMKS